MMSAFVRHVTQNLKWGESASPNVIGHYHIGGNSSHGTYYRVDGEGPCLIFAPQEDTQLLYYDVQKWFNPELNEREQKETEEGKGFTMLYPFAVKRAERAAKKGAQSSYTAAHRFIKARRDSIIFICLFMGISFS